MKSRTILLIAAAATALTACNEQQASNAADGAMASAESTANAAGDMAGSAAMSVGLTTPSSPEFVTKAASSDMYEIESSKLAQQKSTSTAVKTFAAQMIKDHTATSTKLKSLTANDAALKPPTAMSEKHQQMLADLKAAAAGKFDETYIDQQTAAHEEALTLMRSYADGGDNAGLKGLAAETAPKIQQHLTMVQQMDNSGTDDSEAGNANANTH